MSTVTVRAAEPADAAAIAEIYRPYVTDTTISFEEVPPAAAEIAARMGRCPRLPWLVAVDGGTVVGYAYAASHRGRAAYRYSVEVSVYLAASYQGRGLGSRLYGHLLAALRGMGYVNAYAGIALPNARSVRLHEHLGFTAIGVFPAVGYKHGRWHDVGWWHLPLAAA